MLANPFVIQSRLKQRPLLSGNTMLPPPQLPIEPPQPSYAIPQNNSNIQESNVQLPNFNSAIGNFSSNNALQEYNQYQEPQLTNLERLQFYASQNPMNSKLMSQYNTTNWFLNQAKALEDTTGQLSQQMGYRRVIHQERPGYEIPILQPTFVTLGYNPIEDHLSYGNLRKPLETQMKDAYSNYLTQLSKQFYNQYFASPYRPIM